MTALAAPAVRPATTPVAQLRRVRWAVRATLTLGVAASVAANVLHARPNPVSQVIAAWPPLALLLTVELISRVPVHRRSLAAVRLAATATIAGIAAWVSYWHMAGVAARYGEAGPSPYLLPLSVDGLVIVASVSLVELAGRIRATTDHDTTAPSDARPAVDAAPAMRTDSGVESVPQVADPMSGDAEDSTGDDVADSRVQQTARGERVPAWTHRRPAGSDDGQTTSPCSLEGDEHGCDPEKWDAGAPADDTSVPSDTAAAVAYWYRRDPKLHPAEIGAKIGRSERTVRRYWSGASQRPPATANGDAADHLGSTVRAR